MNRCLFSDQRQRFRPGSDKAWIPVCVIVLSLMFAAFTGMQKITKPDFYLWKTHRYDCVTPIAERYSVPRDVVAQLAAMSRSGNRGNGKSYLIIVLVDSDFSNVIDTQLCSWRQTDLDPTRICYICLDEKIYRHVQQWEYSAIHWKKCNLTYRDRHRMKLVMARLVLAFDVECYIVDSDIIFFRNFMQMWSFNSDIEACSDRDDMVQIRQTMSALPFNSGLVRYSGSPGSRYFLDQVLEYAESREYDKDQKLFNYFLRLKTQKTNGKTFTAKIHGRAVKFSVVEPLLAPSGGVLFCKGRNALTRFAVKMQVSSPVLVHLNWHWPIEAKARTVSILGLQRNLSFCTRLDWPFWFYRKFPVELNCTDDIVKQYDGESASLNKAYLEHEVEPATPTPTPTCNIFLK